MYLMAIVCMNVDMLTSEAASNTHIPIQIHVPPVVTHLQASQCKCAFVGGLLCIIFNTNYLIPPGSSL